MLKHFCNLHFIVNCDNFAFVGKFQMQVLPQCGHAVHEDVPDKVMFNFIPVVE